MKKRNSFINFFMALALVFGLAACATTSTQSGPGEYVDDSVITTKVKAQLSADDFLGSFDIGVETFKGVVQLSGFVDSQAAIDKALQITWGVGGVTAVRNALIVK